MNRFDAFEPTRKQLRALGEISAAMERRGTPPTLRELADDLGLAAPSSVQPYIRALVEAGFLTSERNPRSGSIAARTLRLTERGRELLERAERLRTARLARGKRELVLTEAELSCATKLGLPVRTLHVYTEHGSRIVVFGNRTDRDLWADLILQDQGRGKRP